MRKHNSHRQIIVLTLRIATVLALTGVGAYIGVFMFDLFGIGSGPATRYSADDTGFLKIVSVSVVAVVLAGLAFSWFLEAGPQAFRRLAHQVSSTEAAIVDQLEDRKTDLIRVRSELAALGFSDIHPSLDEKRAFADDLRESLKTQASQEFLAEIRGSLVSDQREKDVLLARSEVLRRLEGERSRIARRGNFNLFIGLITTIVGITLLVMYANDQEVMLSKYFEARVAQPVAKPRETQQVPSPPASTPPQRDSSAAWQKLDLSEHLVLFLPRLSIIVLIELFAYFFLNLYKASLSDGKYVQNEITSVELRILGLLMALRTEPATLAPILQSYVQTDRNQATPSAVSPDVTRNERAKILGIINELLSSTK